MGRESASPTGPSRPSVLLVHARYRQRAGEDAVFDAERELLERMGHDVDALVVDNRSIPDDPGIGGRLRLGIETIWSHRSARLIRDRLRGRPADIVHVHNPFPLLSPSIYAAAGATGAAVVQTIHNYRPVCPAATLYRDGRPCEDCVGRRVAWPSVVHACYRGSRAQTLPVAAMLAATRIRGTWRHVDAFIVLTPFAAAKLEAGGLPADRIHIKPNFVEDPGGRDGPGNGFLFVGRLAEEKGIGTIIDAAPDLAPGVTIRIAGDGPEEARLADAAGLHPSLRPLGRLDAGAVQAALTTSRALVFPSRWYEGMPIVILEAFAAGVPVIAARIGAAASLVRDGETGRTFEPGDAAGLAAALAWAETHPDEMASFGRAARSAYLDAYTPDASYRRLIDVYRIAQGRAAARRRAA